MNFITTKVICIDDSNLPNFRIKPIRGKEYLVRWRITLSGVEYDSVELINDEGRPTGIVYKKERFSTLKEWRNRQLNKLGI